MDRGNTRMKIYMEDNLCTVYKLLFNKMHNFFKNNGQVIVTKPSEADIIVIGLCAAFDADEFRSSKIISRMEKLCKLIYTYGCLTKVNPGKIGKKIMFPSWDSKGFVESIVKNPEVCWEDTVTPTEFRLKSDYRIYNPRKQLVNISTGCSFDCSYCPHKIGAGEIKSRSQKEILQQVKCLIKRGIQTIVLTGIDTACYGKDLDISFPRLLEMTLKICAKNTNLHIAQYNPEGLSMDFKKMVACCSDNRVSDMQLPIQSSSERLLNLMNRNYSKEIISEFIQAVKAENKRIFFRTDIMVGFPTETKKELHNSIDFVARYFNEVAIYSFELKCNTKIASSGLEFFTANEIKGRKEYAIKKLKSAGVIVHSGGQDIVTLLKADRAKEKIRK